MNLVPLFSMMDQIREEMVFDHKRWLVDGKGCGPVEPTSSWDFVDFC